MATTSDGQTVDLIRVKLIDYGWADDLSIKDAGHYEPGTVMHETLLNDVNPGDRVVVSGSFRYDHDDDVSDCFHERNTWLSGGMTDPDYSASFRSIRPADTGTE